MNQDYIKSLLQKYASGDLSDQEREILSEAIRTADDKIFLDLMEDHEEISWNADRRRNADDAFLQLLQDKISAMEDPVMVRKAARVRYWAFAAGLLLLILAGTWLYRQQHAGNGTAYTPDIAAATPKATLTLGDGSIVMLDSAGNRLIPQGGTSVRQQGGVLVYQATGNEENVSINTLSTPRGGQFAVQLPDGSRAWLNAASSLRYPTAFREGERRVEVTGEVYFEVAAQASAPFIVKVKDKLLVKVLGTNFNINAYEDDRQLYTTLLAGRVQVDAPAANKKMELQPSQQAVLTKDGNLDLNKAPDLERVMAWRNGIFYFENAELREVMAQLSRWYDVDVEFEKDVRKLYFSGKLQRGLGLSQLLSVLDMSGIHYRITGRKIVIESAER
ncbi:FecR family protein [Chitinophaga cymbidii]|uniref:Iron dicitrate transporter FecR n=1 Tax=Chitinophaga cymbidii TaxID=1096750 RepID=A0A512RPQ1_9BACT|nr:FecR family protein [Chitinophaga cymbidii]GEP97654.1 iron dicitrate transporter FecR [Chitinophaga cymbidii]